MEIVFVLVVACMILYVIYESVRRHNIRQSHWEATGIVTQLHTRRNGPGRADDHWGEATYTTHWGQTRVVRFNGYIKNGSAVRVRYNERGAYVPWH